MRFTLDTVGKTDWTRDSVGRPVYPEGFEEVADKLDRPLHPPGRDLRCIVSVGMLTEGWDCNTVTHIIGLRPFMSQLLCEQVVGRALRRSSYEVGEDGLMLEEVAWVLGVPFEIVPFKKGEERAKVARQERAHVHALPERAALEIRFPRVEGYRQAVRNRVTVEWSAIAPLRLDPVRIPPEVEAKAYLPTNRGRPTLSGPGALKEISLKPYRVDLSIEGVAFELARDLARELLESGIVQVPIQVLFPQLVEIARRYLVEKVEPVRPHERVDVGMSPYYGWAIERLSSAVRGDESSGDAPELPRYEANRPAGSTADVDFWTGKPVVEVQKSHVNRVVADTRRWEQSAAYHLDRHPAVEAFVKNAGLGFTIPYLHNGEPHDYVPDFVVRLRRGPSRYLILETKGYDPLKEVKRQAAERWVAAVNADARHGVWECAVANAPEDIPEIVQSCASQSR
jgi:type III restriction enzyme